MVPSTLINLDEIVLTNTVDEFTTSLGIDSFAHCLDKEHYNSSTKLIVYKFNSLGYRDEEWPDDITDCVWCVGDSFTIGIGQVQEDTWHQLVQSKLNARTINISMNGASNTWIARRVKFILDTFKPHTILIQWSYVHRREDPDTSKPDELRALNFDPNDLADFENLTANIMQVESLKQNTKLVHSFIPKFFDSNVDADKATVLYKTLSEKNILYFEPPEQVDLARDGYHYDVITAGKYADLYTSLL
jgi:hypothetical protein